MLVGSGPGIAEPPLHRAAATTRISTSASRARVNEGGNSGVYYRARFGPKFPAKEQRWLVAYNAKLDEPRLGAFLPTMRRRADP